MAISWTICVSRAPTAKLPSEKQYRRTVISSTSYLLPSRASDQPSG